MLKAAFIFVGLLIVGQSTFAQSIFQRQDLFRQGLETIEENRRQTIKAVEEAYQLKDEASYYFYTKKNKKLACLTIKQAYEVELQSGYSEPSTRTTIRKYCG